MKAPGFCGGAWVAILLAALLFGAAPPKQPYTTWSDYGGSADSMQYSALKQINKTNVKQLELAWSYPVPGTTGRFGFNPLIVDGAMYVLGKDRAIVALDAATGKQIWSHPVDGNATDRGINYWRNKEGSDRRLIFSANSFLGGCSIISELSQSPGKRESRRPRATTFSRCLGNSDIRKEA